MTRATVMTQAIDGSPNTIDDSATDPVLNGAERYARRRLKLYVFTVCLLPLLFLASAIPIVRSDSFPAESADPFLRHSEYPFSLKGVDCEVVIFGDSTAVTGIDPTQVEKATGMKTCNIAESQSILEIVGMDALDTYLRNNAAPKYVLMQFSPEVLGRRRDFFWAEGLTLLLRKKSLAAAMPVLVRHPIEFYNFAMWAIKAKVHARNSALPDFAVTDEIFRARGGLIILPKPPQTECVLNTPHSVPSRPWIGQLKQKYTSGVTRVIVNVAPVPACTRDIAQIADSLQNIADNDLPIYPIGLFCDVDRHLNLEGAERSSAQIGSQILALERLHAPGTGAH